MLGPLAVEERKKTKAAPVLEDLAVEQFQSAFPNAFRSPELILPRDPVLETMQQEARTREVWKRLCPGVYEARERLDVAERAHTAAFSAYRERQRQLARAQNDVGHANPNMPGEKADRQAQVAIATGFLEVARFHAELALEELDAARAHLKAVTAPALVTP
jgi:hypothetical protein